MLDSTVARRAPVFSGLCGVAATFNRITECAAVSAMNQKQYRRELRLTDKASRERSRMRRARKLVHWCNSYGYAVYVMDDPTELHAKALLLRYVAPTAPVGSRAWINAERDKRTEAVILTVLKAHQ